MLYHIKDLQQNKQPHRQISLFAQISRQVKQWQQLSALIQPLLPQPEQWQIVCYQAGVLTIAGHNQTMVSQLNYLRTQYTAKIAQLDAFRDLHSIQATLLPIQPQVKQNTSALISRIDDDGREVLASAVEGVQDPALKQALEKLARTPYSF